MPTLAAIKQGATFRLPCRYLDGGGDPVDLTGYTITSTLKSQESNAVVQALTVAVTDAAGGLFEVRATATETATWPPEAVAFDVRIADGAGTVVYSEDCKFLVRKSYTA